MCSACKSSIRSFVGTFHAKPMSSRNAIETNAMCMVGGIACIAEEEDFFMVGFPTEGAGADLLLFKFVLDPCIWIELSNLFFVFDLVFGYNGT